MKKNTNTYVYGQEKMYDEGPIHRRSHACQVPSLDDGHSSLTFHSKLALKRLSSHTCYCPAPDVLVQISTSPRVINRVI